jgi:hypothetical protein
VLDDGHRLRLLHEADDARAGGGTGAEVAGQRRRQVRCDEWSRGERPTELGEGEHGVGGAEAVVAEAEHAHPAELAPQCAIDAPTGGLQRMEAVERCPTG